MQYCVKAKTSTDQFLVLINLELIRQQRETEQANDNIRAMMR